jgi:hypothetical protein
MSSSKGSILSSSPCSGSRVVNAVVRVGLIVCLWVAGAVLAGCGGDRSIEAPVMLPSSGRAYRALDEVQRTAVAAMCRDGAAERSRGLAARQLRAVDAAQLRDEIDSAYFVVADRHRPVADICAEVIAFVTPGLRVTFDGAEDQRDGTFTFETSSDKRLTISGRVDPPPAHARVVVHRELGPRVRHIAAIDADGRFVIARLRLRKIADNSFNVTIDAPPNAPRKVVFIAICLDCLAGGPPPTTQQ